MANRIMDPIGRLMGLRYKSHPWHGVDIGKNAPEQTIDKQNRGYNATLP